MRDNLTTALAVVSLLRDEGLEIPDEAIGDGIAGVRWPGRLQYVQGGAGRPDLVLEVGHNPLAARTVAGELGSRAGDRPVGLVVALAGDKDLHGFLEPLVAGCSRLTATSWSEERARDPEEIEQVFRSLAAGRGRVIPTAVVTEPVRAVRETAHEIGEEGIVVALGSHLLVGPLLEVLDRSGSEGLIPPR